MGRGDIAFDRHYDSTGECFILGKVEFGKGDFITFPAGLSCVWDIKEPVRKHYDFP